MENAHDHFISCLKFNAKYGVIASTGNDMKVKIWHLKWLVPSIYISAFYSLFIVQRYFILIISIVIIENCIKKEFIEILICPRQMV